MGAEPGFSPLEPEPTHSPEPEIPGHDDRNWKADMMSALGESVSFGRFLTEPLEWGKWSAFAHNRYLEEAAVQARPGSVAQKKAFFEAHYARKKKRKSEDHGAAAGDDGGLEAGAAEDGGSAASMPSSSAESSCMTDQAPAPGDEETCGSGEAGVVDCGGPVEVAEELAAANTTGAVGPSCTMDAPVDELCHRERGNEQVAGAVSESPEKKDLCSSNLVVVDAVEKQPLKESSIVNQDITDSAKKRRIQMSSLLHKPNRFRSPPSGKKGQPSSVKRRSPLHSEKENTSPHGKDNNMHGATSGPQNKSILAALHMPKSFTRCETGNAASGSRNLGTTIAERISQLESASRPVETTQPEEFGPPRKTFSTVLPAPEVVLGTSQVDEQRSSHVMRIKEKLFGSTSPLVHQKTAITKEKERKFNNELEFKQSRQSFCFKARPLPNFCRRNKQVKDTNQQTVQEFPKFRDSNHSMTDGSHAQQMGKGVSKERQICCFPIRKLY